MNYICDVFLSLSPSSCFIALAGCYYLLKHYQNGEQIETNEPCLNCSCVNSMLMCYLRVCPYVRPIGDKCIIEKVPGDCCPRITCPDGNNLLPLSPSFRNPFPVPPYFPVTWSMRNCPVCCPQSPRTRSQSQLPHSLKRREQVCLTRACLPLNDAIPSITSGCYVEGKHFREGTQMPPDAGKPCEICYCIRNTSACVSQECSLGVPGCQPTYSPNSCCPTRYNCCE